MVPDEACQYVPDCPHHAKRPEQDASMPARREFGEQGMTHGVIPAQPNAYQDPQANKLFRSGGKKLQKRGDGNQDKAEGENAGQCDPRPTPGSGYQ